MAVLDLKAYEEKGHATVTGVFTAAEMEAVTEDIGRWGEEFLRELPASQRRWYLDGGVKAKEVLRKLDNPHHLRESVRSLARDPEALITAWIAFDDATVENGCMYFGEGTHLRPVMPQVTPPDEPFNLQIPADAAAKAALTAAPVPKGGVSFHHGGVLHQSGPNHSQRWRRACALHYVRNDNAFMHPALPYDEKMFLKIT